MRHSLVEPDVKKNETIEVVKARSEREARSARAADPKRKAEFRTAIEASTARILSIAVTRVISDPDPEAA